MLDFEFNVCEDCLGAVAALEDAANVLGDTTSVDVLAYLCSPCAASAQKALQGGPMWN